MPFRNDARALRPPWQRNALEFFDPLFLPKRILRLSRPDGTEWVDSTLPVVNS